MAWIFAGHTQNPVRPWNSECNGDEVNHKNGFEEHHNARGRTKKLRFTEWCRVLKANLVRKERIETLLYTLGTPEYISRERWRGQRRSGTEKCRTFDRTISTVWELKIGMFIMRN